MSVQPIGGWLVLKHPQYVEEVTYGVFPTNPAMAWPGSVERCAPRADMQSTLVPQLGTEDLKYIIKGAEVYTIELEYGLQNTAFTKYATNGQGLGAGSIDKSLSLLFSAKLGGQSGTENFLQLLGSRIGSLTLSSRVGELTRARCQISGKAIPVTSSTNPIGIGSFATDIATPPWTFYDGGVNPITIGAVNPDVREFTVIFERNLERLHVLGQSQQKFLPPKHRRITGNFTILWEDTNQYTNLTTDTGVTITWVLKTGGGNTLTLNGCKLIRLEDFPFHPTEIVVEKYAFTALNANLV